LARLNCDCFPSMHASHGPWTTEHGQTLPSWVVFAHFPPRTASHNVEHSTTSHHNLLDNSRQSIFIDRVKAGCINIDDTTPAAIDAIQNKYWGHKSLCSFCTNYRKVASDLQVERHIHGGRGMRMSSVLLHDHTPLSLIFPLS
jgi:hypothetical protein